MITRMEAYIVNSLSCQMYKKDYKEFLNIKDLRMAQEKILLGILARNQEAEYGRAYDFCKIKSILDFQERVPLTDYEDYVPYIERILKGEKGVLTEEEVLLLEPSSGSASASKFIPYTQSLKNEFQNGIRPWLYDLYSTKPGIKSGKSYWSVTPAATKRRHSEAGIPIGFEEDQEYFGALEKKLLDRVMAVPGGVAKAETMEDFYYQTSLALLQCKELTLISIWNPTFLLLILDFMKRNSESLASEIDTRDRIRAKEVRGFLEQEDFNSLWKDLKLISCWGDANAGIYAQRLMELFPGVELQPKGLLATEGFVSFPLTEAGGAVLSIRSHFFEFQAQKDGRIYTADQLIMGDSYSVILTTSGGFYRYRLKDLIRVKGFYRGIPVIEFLGKQDKVSDLFGEKLNEIFVRNTLEKLGIKEGFHMLAPETDRYVFFTADPKITKEHQRKMDQLLRENFHYDYCRKLGQLKEMRIFKLTGNPEKEYLEECVRRGQRLGDIKTTPLQTKGGWDKSLKGEYL